MDMLALKFCRDGRPVVVHRQHDLSGTDYARIVALDRIVANAIDARGAVAWADMAGQHAGRPGLILTPVDNDTVTAEVRADMADPTTLIETGRMSAQAARLCVPDGSAPLRWLIPPDGSAALRTAG